MNEQDSLGLYLHWLADRRRDDEARLKRLGLNWKVLDKIESEAISQFPPEGISIEGFRFVAGTRIKRVLPEEIASKYAKITETFISIHKEN